MDGFCECSKVIVKTGWHNCQTFYSSVCVRGVRKAAVTFLRALFASLGNVHFINKASAVETFRDTSRAFYTLSFIDLWMKVNAIRKSHEDFGVEYESKFSMRRRENSRMRRTSFGGMDDGMLGRKKGMQETGSTSTWRRNERSGWWRLVETGDDLKRTCWSSELHSTENEPVIAWAVLLWTEWVHVEDGMEVGPEEEESVMKGVLSWTSLAPSYQASPPIHQPPKNLLITHSLTDFTLSVSRWRTSFISISWWWPNEQLTNWLPFLWQRRIWNFNVTSTPVWTPSNYAWECQIEDEWGFEWGIWFATCQCSSSGCPRTPSLRFRGLASICHKSTLKSNSDVLECPAREFMS